VGGGEFLIQAQRPFLNIVKGAAEVLPTPLRKTNKIKADAYSRGTGVQTVFAGRDGDGDGVAEGGISFHSNEFSDNPDSVGLTMAFFPGAHEIIGNAFERNAVGIGEFLGVGVVGHNIQANRISDNLLGGIFVCTVGNTIRANRVQNNGDVGIGIEGFCIDFGDGVAKDNLIQANTVIGTAGIDLVGTCDNVFKANRFATDSEGDGPRKGCIR
jgi:parallel beta-helix repeat protein